MTTEEKRIKIAEHLGWTQIKPITVTGEPYGILPPLRGWIELPDYFEDLDAMHEAEKLLRNQFSLVEEAYWRNLEGVKPHPIYATAAQRAEAFGKTLNLW